MSIPPPRFRVARPGYETPAVDAFIERVARALETRPVRITSDDVRSARFPLAQSRPGYAVADVDAWIGHVVAALSTDEARFRSQHATTHTTPSPAISEGDSRGFRHPRRRVAVPPDPGRSAVQELPATPLWVRITALILIVGMLGLFVVSYLV